MLMHGNRDGVLIWRKKMKMDEVNVLGQILETGFGKSSSSSGTYSIKTSLAGNTLTVKYITVVHFASERGLTDQVARYNNEAAQMINSYMKEVKTLFKNSAGRALKTKDLGGADDVELLQSNARAPRKTAYYRFNRTFEIE
jgi:hypothetical protein